MDQDFDEIGFDKIDETWIARETQSCANVNCSFSFWDRYKTTHEQILVSPFAMDMFIPERLGSMLLRKVQIFLKMKTSETKTEIW